MGGEGAGMIEGNAKRPIRVGVRYVRCFENALEDF